MIYPQILRCLLLSALVAATQTACSHWNEPEMRRPVVVAPSAQDPAAYAAYTAAIRAWKTTPHQIAGAIFDNAPDRSTSERDFLRSLPDSLDFVVMRNAATLSPYDVEDIAVVRRDFATRILYHIDAAIATPDHWHAASSAIASGQFDGALVAAAATAPDAGMLALLPADCMLVFAGSPSLLPEADRARFQYFIVDIAQAKDAYDVEMALRLAALAADHSQILLGTAPGTQLTDMAGVSRNSLAGAAVAARDAAPQLGGIAISDVRADYYDPDIIYRRTRGAIQILNPAK